MGKKEQLELDDVVAGVQERWKGTLTYFLEQRYHLAAQYAKDVRGLLLAAQSYHQDGLSPSENTTIRSPMETETETVETADAPDVPAAATPPAPPTISDQLKALREEAYSDTVIRLVRQNSHMSLAQLSETIGDDPTANTILLNTPLHDLVPAAAAAGDAGVNGKAPEPEAAPPKNGHRKKKAPPRMAAKSKKGTKKTGKKKRKYTDIDDFLTGREKGDTFKTAEYRDGLGISQPTALKELKASKAVRSKGERRGMHWVVR